MRTCPSVMCERRCSLHSRLACLRPVVLWSCLRFCSAQPCHERSLCSQAPAGPSADRTRPPRFRESISPRRKRAPETREPRPRRAHVVVLPVQAGADGRQQAVVGAREARFSSSARIMLHGAGQRRCSRQPGKRSRLLRMGGIEHHSRTYAESLRAHIGEGVCVCVSASRDNFPCRPSHRPPLNSPSPRP